MSVHITVEVTTDGLSGLRQLARHHRCQPENLAGLSLRRVFTNSLTSQFDVGSDANALRAMSFGTYREVCPVPRLPAWEAGWPSVLSDAGILTTQYRHSPRTIVYSARRRLAHRIP